MQLNTNIQQLYRPVQPTVKQSAHSVTYTEVGPEPSLQHIIHCYWELKTTQFLDEPFVYRVVADGCIDLFFELSQAQENYVMGFCKKFTEFPLAQSFHYVGVRFLPAMFPQLFGVNASALSNRYEALGQVVPALSEFIANSFEPGLSLTATKQLFDRYFNLLMAKTRFEPDARVFNALAIILRKQGLVDVEKDLNTGISARQLRRLFEYYIGDSAKTFAKVVRFQNILRAKPSLQSLRQNKLFFDAGYYDQAHFIKEFKTFYGVTPSRAFGR